MVTMAVKAGGLSAEQFAEVKQRVVTMAPLFLRRRDTAALFGVSESVVLIWERAGKLRPIRLPGLRAVRHLREDVEALAREFAKSDEDRP